MISKIGKYEIESEIGVGGFGRVYRAFDPTVKRPVAIKVMTAVEDQDSLRRFQSEVMTTGRLRHPNIVSVFDTGEQDGTAYLVFEFLEGRTLQSLIRDHPQTGIEDKARILAQMAEGLRYAHSQGVIHRDIKPGNAMVLPDGTVKLMDFGIARLAAATTNLTQAGYMIGTLRYMAPEQFTGAEADARTDLFAFGCTAYEFLSGKHPFEARDQVSLMYRITQSEAEPLARTAPDCPEALAQIVHRCLAKDRALRYASAAEMALDLQAVVADMNRERGALLVRRAAEAIDAGALEEANATIQQAVQLDPYNRQARSLRERTQELMQRQAVGEHVSSLLAIAKASLARNELTEANEVLKQATALDPGNAEAHALLEEVSAARAQAQKREAPVELEQAPPRKPQPVPLPPLPQAPASADSRLAPASLGLEVPLPFPITILAAAVGVLAVIALLSALVLNAGSPVPWVLAVLLLAAGLVWFRRRRARGIQPSVEPVQAVESVPAAGLGDRTVLHPAPPPGQLQAMLAAAEPAVASDATSLVARSELPPERLANIALFVVASADPAMVGTSIPVSRFPFRIGRKDADLTLAGDVGVSQQHAVIDFKDDGFFIEDQGSRNGTYVGGRRLRPGVADPLPFGTVIQLSATTLTFHSREMQLLPDLTGATIAGRFKLQESLHSSPRSVTYAAWDANLSLRVAVKILSPQLSRFPGYSEQFRNEALAAAGLRHANICKVLDFGKTSIPLPGAKTAQSHYLCMELMSGGSVKGALEREGGVPPGEALRCVQQIAGALEHAHSQGVVHGGLKPTAIVFDEQRTAYLTDFAIASRPGNETRWTVMGAPAFMAPEQWDGQEATPLSDQYSLAAIAYLLLTGARPYEAQENPEVRKKNFARGPMPAHREAERNGRGALPAAMSAVFQKALATVPDQRYESPPSFAAALEKAFVEPDAGGRTAPRIFISYQREASAGWANLFADKLSEKHGVVAFVDVQSMDSAESFPVRIQKEIESCDFFVCFLAEPTLHSVWVQREIEIAHTAGRRMVPIFQESFEHPKPAEGMGASLRALLDYQGVYLFDRLNIHIDHSVADLANIVSSR